MDFVGVPKGHLEDLGEFLESGKVDAVIGDVRFDSGICVTLQEPKSVP